jgi:hypothetical protein
MLDISLGLGLFVSIVMAGVQVLKEIGLPKKFWPLTALVLGILTNLGVGNLGSNLAEKVIFGCIIGFMAGGVWDLVKLPVIATVKKLKTISFPK